MTEDVELRARGGAVIKRMVAPADRADYNGHLNVRFHFDLLCDAIGDDLERRGFGEDYRAAHRRSLFTIEHSIVYESEIHVGDLVAVSALLDGRVGKALYYSATLKNITRGCDASSMTAVLLHVDLDTRRSVSFDERAIDALDQSLAAAEEVAKSNT